MVSFCTVASPSKCLACSCASRKASMAWAISPGGVSVSPISGSASRDLRVLKMPPLAGDVFFSGLALGVVLAIEFSYFNFGLIEKRIDGKQTHQIWKSFDNRFIQASISTAELR